MIDRRFPAAFLALAFAVTACAGSTGGETPAPTEPTTPTAAPTEPATPEPTSPGIGQPGATATPEPTEPTAPEPILTSDWATVTLTDVETGENFRIADLATEGRTVFVEAMAIWCTNCRRQQHEFIAALGQLDPATVDYVVLTIEPSETAAALADYKRQQGFVGRYAVAGSALSAALSAEFGATILIPPSVPKLVIRDGVPEFITGHHSASEIVALAGR